MDAIQTIQHEIGQLGHVLATNTQHNFETSEPEYFEVEVTIHATRLRSWFRKERLIADRIMSLDWTLEYIDSVEEGDRATLIFTINA